MPIYEYRCQACARVSSFFLKSINSELEPVCAHCQSKDMARRMSSFAMGKTVGSVHENFASGSEHRTPGYYSDPRNIGRNVESAFSKYGVEMPQTVRDNIDAARSGETPKGLDL
ncbi:MAG: zinc ribbon domain-containing protein [SAR202 cluster bacterium]|nr:zinc ribbon domain-containing protein [SAR202 cluster bacterium]